MARISLNNSIAIHNGNHFLLFLLFFTAFTTFLVAANNEIVNINKNWQKNNLVANKNAVEQLNSSRKLDEQMAFTYYDYGDLMARFGRVRRSDKKYKKKMDRDMERQREGRRKPSHDQPNSQHRRRSDGQKKSHGNRQKHGESSQVPEQSYPGLGSGGSSRRKHHEAQHGDGESSSRRHRSSGGRRENSRHKSNEKRKNHRRKSPSSPNERSNHQRSRRPSSPDSRRNAGSSSRSRRRSASSASKDAEQRQHSPCKQIDKMCGFGKSRMNVNAMREMHEFGKRYCVAKKHFAQGGQGQIYVAYSKKHGKCAAYKLVKLESMTSQGMQSSALNEFEVVNHLRKVNEGRKKKKRNQLKRIIRVYENEQRGKSIQTIMDLGETDLYTYYTEKIKNLDGNEKVREIECLIAGILNAMIELHGAGVMHLDFKLENVILMPSEHNAHVKSVKIIDFGAARIVPSYFSSSRNINQSVEIVDYIYTTIYAAPEYAMSEYVNTKADIWSIGVIIGELLTNEDINVNTIVLLKRNKDDSSLAFPDMPFNAYTKRVYRRFTKLKGKLEPYLNNSNNERLWRLALGCLRFESKVRPMALQLLAYMNDWCILGVPSTFAKVMEEKSYSGIKKSPFRGLPMCSDIRDLDYAEKVTSRRHGGKSSRAASSSSLQRKSGADRHASGSRSKSGGNSIRGKKGVFSFFSF